MQFPIVTGTSEDSKMNRRYPHELHWRKDPPAWPGRVGSAYRRLYPHLVDEFCCMQCGSVPCPVDHEEEKRLRLKEMKFVGVIIAEKQALEDKMKEMQSTYESSSLLRQQWETERLQLQKNLKEREYAARSWEKERTTLMKESTRVQTLNTQLNEQLERCQNELEKMAGLEEHMETLQLEKRILLSKTTTQQQAIASLSEEVSRTTAENQSIRQEHIQLTDKAEALTKRLTDSEQVRMNAREVEVQTEPEELRELLAEMEQKTRLLENSDFENQYIICDLREQLSSIESDLEKARTANSELEAKLAQCRSDIEKLQRQLASDRGFKQYVEVLRQLNDIKNLNEDLLTKIGPTSRPLTIMTSSTTSIRQPARSRSTTSSSRSLKQSRSSVTS